MQSILKQQEPLSVSVFPNQVQSINNIYRST